MAIVSLIIKAFVIIQKSLKSFKNRNQVYAITKINKNCIAKNKVLKRLIFQFISTCYIVICRIINDSIIKTHTERRKRKTQEETTQEWRTQEDFFNNILPLTLFVRVRKGCWRVACEWMLETEHKLHILTPLLWPSRCVFLVLLMLGSTPSGFPRTPSVGCGLPYHIWSLLSGSLLATASGVSEVPLGRVWPSLPHLVSNPLGFCWQLHRGVPRSPSVACGLPYHISSLTLWESAGNCLGLKLNWVK